MLINEKEWIRKKASLMLILSLWYLRIELSFSIFLLHETLLRENMALAQEQVCADHSSVFHLDALL